MNRLLWWLATSSGVVFLLNLLLPPKTTYVMLPYPPQAHSELELLFLAARHNFRIAVGLASLGLFVVFIA